MSKKSRKNPSKTTPAKVAKSALMPTAKKPAAKAPVKAATKSPAKKVAAKAVKAPARKTAAKVAAKPKAAVAKKAAPKAAVGKAAPKPATKPAAGSKAAPKATALKATASKTASSKSSTTAPKAPAPTPAAPKPVQKVAPAVAVEGSTAPAFALPRDNGATVALSDYAGQKLVIFFYPRASTPGCTKEAIDFTRLTSDFQAAGTAILGVSADPLKAQETFRNKHDLTMPLLSDDTQQMLKAYGAWGEKSMYGKVFEGVLRTTVLIDADGQVAKIWRSVKVDGHADAVLEEARRI